EKNMKNYKKLTIDEIHNVDLMDGFAYEGKVIIEVLVNEETKRIGALTSYAIDSNCESYYTCLVKRPEELKESVITQYLIPHYGFECDHGPHMLCADIDIQSDFQNVLSEFEIRRHFEKYKEDYKPGFHYEVYVSKEKSDLGEFGSSLELEFIEEWLIEKGEYTPRN
ncbi:MAG: hypothetical protein IKV44_05805, partial [Clostridia bacterium]|nr:hypothetical protein [Clostridia bacterium]